MVKKFHRRERDVARVLVGAAEYVLTIRRADAEFVSRCAGIQSAPPPRRHFRLLWLFCQDFPGFRTRGFFVFGGKWLVFQGTGLITPNEGY
jgi:hypothetical protein